MCEAEERNQQAVYELELQWGAGRLDLGRIRGILTGREQCTGHDPLERFLNDPEGHRLVNAIHQRKHKPSVADAPESAARVSPAA